MKEKDKLKEICNKIGLWKQFWDWILIKSIWYYPNNNYDVREIIFRQDFMEKYFYHLWLTHDEEVWVQLWMFENLDNIVDYLYKLIK